MTVTAKRLTNTDDLFMNAYQAISELTINLQSLPQNKQIESRTLLNAASDDLVNRLNGLREFDR